MEIGGSSNLMRLKLNRPSNGNKYLKDEVKGSDGKYIVSLSLDNILLKQLCAFQIRKHLEQRKLKEKKKQCVCNERNAPRNCNFWFLTACLIIIGIGCSYVLYQKNEKEETALVLYSSLPKHEHFNPDLVIDFALASAGAEINGKPNAVPYVYKIQRAKIFFFTFTFDIPDSSKSASIFLEPGRSPGECWAFVGHQASFQIKLSRTIFPWAVTIDHIPKFSSPSGGITSAPRHFSVYAIDGDIKEYLGNFEYKYGGEPTQSFFLEYGDSITYPTRILEFQIHTNHGNPRYTCIYKIRVHGDLFQ